MKLSHEGHPLTVRYLLQRSGLPLLEARALLGYATGWSREALIAHDDSAPHSVEVHAFEDLAARRRAGEPLAYLLGEREFYGRNFRVAPGVLIPRPETELLCELALARLAGSSNAEVVDLGAGSGIIPITLLLEHPGASVTATDFSAIALKIAQDNAQRYAAAVHFVQGSWYAPLAGQRFDLILSNPPYIAPGDPHLTQGDLRFEPPHALVADEEGLAALREIVEGAPQHLRPGGWLMLEHGYNQAAAVRQLMEEVGLLEVQSHADLAGIERVTQGRLHSGNT